MHSVSLYTLSRTAAFISDRTLFYSEDQLTSECFAQLQVIQQGDVVSPLPFNINMSGLSLIFYIWSVTCADDTSIICKLVIITIAVWYPSELFVTTSHVTVGNVATASNSVIDTQFRNKPIPNLQKVKDLGVEYDNKLSWNIYLDLVFTGHTTAKILLRRFSSGDWGGCGISLLLFQKCYVRTILEYCWTLSSDLPQYHLAKLHILELRALRLWRGPPRGVANGVFYTEARMHYLQSGFRLLTLFTYHCQFSDCYIV